MKFCIFGTDLGWAAVVYSETGLCRVLLPDEDEISLKGYLNIEPGWVEVTECEAAIALQEYFRGVRKAFDLKLDWSWATPFQLKVLEQVALIPYGQTLSYGEVATLAGSPRAARAVGTALSRNSIPVVIPCHRVLGSDGRLGGFTSRHGISDKIALLALESRQLKEQD